MEISKTSNIRAIIKHDPKTRAIFDRYGLLECGGAAGPSEPLGFFARTHNVDIDTLINELRTVMGDDRSA